MTPDRPQLRVLASHTLGFVNPYLTRLYETLSANDVHVEPFRAKALLCDRIDVWHLHWPESIANRGTTRRALSDLVRLWLLLVVARRRHIAVAWTVHNAAAHDTARPRIDRLVRDILTRRLDGWIALSDEAAAEAIEAMPRLRQRRFWVIPHGDYRRDYAASPPRDDAKRALGLPADSIVLVYFGLIRPYKNVPALIDAFRQIDEPTWRLVIAGKPLGEDEAALWRAADGDERIHLRLEHIDDAEVPMLVGAGDLTVLPFKRILNSGSAILALSLDRPILVPHRGSMPSLARQVGAPWVQTYDGELSAQLLRESVDVARTVRGRPPMDAFDWGAIGASTAAAFRTLRACATGPRRLRA